MHSVSGLTMQARKKFNGKKTEFCVYVVEKLLLPGEIEDLSREVEKLSGYRSVTIEQVKKK